MKPSLIVNYYLKKYEHIIKIIFINFFYKYFKNLLFMHYFYLIYYNYNHFPAPQFRQ
jgi:hypothetical protein